MARQVPTVHSVHIYDDQHALVTRLCAIFSTALRLGESALVIGTVPLREQLVSALEDAGIDVRLCAREGRYTMLDVDGTLATFMRDGKPSAKLFRDSVGGILREAQQRARDRSKGLTVFGEMVAKLWLDGQEDAALQLEGLWNAALHGETFHLHCAYPRKGFHEIGDIGKVHSLHTHILQ